MAIRKGVNSCKLVLQRCCDGAANGGQILSPRPIENTLAKLGYFLVGEMLQTRCHRLVDEEGREECGQ